MFAVEKRKDELFQKNKAILATVRHMVQNSPTAVSTVVQDRTPVSLTICRCNYLVTNCGI